MLEVEQEELVKQMTLVHLEVQEVEVEGAHIIYKENTLHHTLVLVEVAEVQKEMVQMRKVDEVVMVLLVL